ncbi:IS110 family transposase [Leisingera sp. M658]|uniref:IS110 family transposase n=1 Tax=Leisingera sp. M658 TaxID=2867015 RepID=UPI0021A41047|nr:IS110 family transposase [Leisingera sp. M658]UWQ77068.1 IS110 family transposase [Leisingera sp. M658]
MDLFIGFDVSLASTAICVLSSCGKVVKEANAASEPEALTAFLHDLAGNVEAEGLEAGPLSQWLHMHLTAAGFAVVLMETRHVKSALKAMPVKTDRRDAFGIARLLQMGWFRPVHCKSVSAQKMRAVLTTRKAILNAAIKLEQSTRGILRNFGLKMGQVTKTRFETRVRKLANGNPMLEAAVAPILRLRVELRDELADLERLLRDMARHDTVCRLMMTMPGVGAIVALTVRSAIDDPARFRSSKDAGPWVGLTPRRDQSEERDISGHITRAGGEALRTALFQAATTMLRCGRRNWLGAWALRVAARHGQKRATTALARRIGVVLHRLWCDGTEFSLSRRDAAMATA